MKKYKASCSCSWEGEYSTPGGARIALSKHHCYPSTQCLVDGCDRPREKHGLCNAHNERLNRTGDVGSATIANRTGPREIPLEQRFWAKVDRRGPDECWPWIGSRESNGSAGRIKAAGSRRRLPARRVAAELSGLRLDMIRPRCGDKACVNPAHLTGRRTGTPPPPRPGRHTP